MKTNQKGFTTYEVLIVIGLISMLFSSSLYSLGFLRDTQDDKRKVIEQQLNFGMIEYYGLFGKYPFEYDQINGLAINPTVADITLNEDSVIFILEELEKYAGYRVQDFDTVESFLDRYEVKLSYHDPHVAQLKIENRP